MTPRRKKRLYLVVLVLVGVSAATALALTAFRENLVYFYSPTEIARGQAPENRTFRIGGLVKDGSVERSEDSLDVRFVITDTAHHVPIEYSGVLPDLFREGQGIVANGKLTADGVFKAEQVLAKHDEEYMPPEAAEALKKAGAKPPHSMAEQ
ncbi:cytochrome c maturation protein CcmE [Thiohalorhabdus methylotrophus]|uniref:Cytochrome c-type biogenesis protein CcmE n=1 Tax=Thiohalorhabdus methylotrophus TaxID=3242694 RepID=A0ABV4TS29_9GAMM